MISDFLLLSSLRVMAPSSILVAADDLISFFSRAAWEEACILLKIKQDPCC